MTPLSINDLPIVFADITPIPQDDGPPAETAAVGRIDYAPDFVVAYDMFRAILRRDERSHRALQLTELCLQLNPANYTVWHFRRQCWLEHPEQLWPGPPPGVDYDLQQLAGHHKVGGDNPKNYQIWYHRRALLEVLCTLVTERAAKEISLSSLSSPPTTTLSPSFVMQAYYQKELDYSQTVIQADSKNYHAWSHRQWVVQQLSQLHRQNKDNNDKDDNNDNNNNDNKDDKNDNNKDDKNDNNNDKNDNDNVIWIQEQGYTDVLIQMDPRNNSAWNHRWFVIHRGQQPQPQQPQPQQQQQQEEEQPPEEGIVTRGYRLDLATAKQEAEYALQGARLDPFNESPWRYLIAILKEQLPGMEPDKRLELLSEFEEKAWSVQDVLQEFYGSTTTTTTTTARSDEDSVVSCPNLISAVIDILECKGDTESLEKVYAMTKVMAEQHDTIRRNYWNLRCRQVEDELAKKQTTTTTTK